MAEVGFALTRSRVHRALSRPNLLMGADRELVLLTALAAIILIFVVLTRLPSQEKTIRYDGTKACAHL
ncbi:type IV secretory pathway TrbD component [Shinella sp. BE166]